MELSKDKGKKRRISYKKEYLNIKNELQEKEGQVLELQRELSSLEKKFREQEKELDSIDNEADEYLDYLRRLKAEFDNYKKRSLKEQERRISLFSEALIKQFLPTMDDLERALGLVKRTKDTTNFVQGVEIIFNQLKNILEKQGLKEIKAKGELFDPHFHEAMMKVELEKYPDNLVVEEIRKGYKLKDRVLRPAMVKVNKKSQRSKRKT